MTARWKRSGRAAMRGGVLIAGLLLCTPASARADWMIAGFIGNPWTMPSTATISIPGEQTQIDLVGLHYRSDSFETPPYYGYRVAWIPAGHPGISFEGEFIHAKVFAETDRVVRVRGTLHGVSIDQSVPLSTIVQNLAMSHGLNFIFANVVLRRGLGAADGHGDHRFTGTLRAGAGPTLPHAKSTVEEEGREQYESGGIGLQGGAGVEVALGAGLRAFGEYKFTWASPHLDIAGGEAHIPARSHHVVGGLAYRF
jgi:hypothetical protein